MSAAVLIAIGARTLWFGWRARLGLDSAGEAVSPRRGFLTAVAATALNPLTIALWTVSFPAAAPPQATRSVSGAAATLVGVGLGLLTWYGGFSSLVALLRERVGERLLRLVDLVTGVGLIAFGVLLGYPAVV